MSKTKTYMHCNGESTQHEGERCTNAPVVGPFCRDCLDVLKESDWWSGWELEQEDES